MCLLKYSKPLSTTEKIVKKTKQNTQNKLRFLTTYNVYYIKKTKIPIMWNKMKMHIVSRGVNLYNHYGDQD